MFTEDSISKRSRADCPHEVPHNLDSQRNDDPCPEVFSEGCVLRMNGPAAESTSSVLGNGGMRLFDAVQLPVFYIAPHMSAMFTSDGD